MWTLVESAAVTVMAAQLMSIIPVTTFNYDYQPYALKQLPDVSKGGATLTEAEVKEGDQVWTTTQEVAELKPGVEVLNSAGETVKYETGTVKMNQLTVTFEYVDGIKWEDGQPMTKADFELGLKIDCDPDSGSTSFSVCESRQKVEFEGDAKHTITYYPGAVWPEYQEYVISAYPAHQLIESEGPNKGKKLAEVPVKDWATLPEIAEDPLSSGPYKLVEWIKGQKMVFEANENFFKGKPKLQTVTIQFIEDTNQAVAQLLTGDVDIVDKTTLGAGPEVETVLKAAAEGKINAATTASPTWEHVDFNLYVK
jgi:ABC-type transport system substrate-binding protein